MKRLIFAVATAGALWTAACGGGGGSNVQPPPPMGKYSNASLNGQYAFVTDGTVITAGGESPLARVGSFTANGQGVITTGMEDVNAAGTVSSAVQITGGSYTVNADGHGTLMLNTAGGSFNFGIVLTSTSTGGLLIDETANANQLSTGSGNFVLQQTPFALSELASTYVFDFSGLDSTEATQESLIGEFTVSGATGTIPSGFFDENDGGSLTSGQMAQGSVSQDPAQGASLASFGRGVATINGQTFVFYIVNSNQVRFLSTNNGMLSGDAIAQSANVPTSIGGFNGSFAFILSGSSNNGGITKVGRFSVNNGAVSNVLADVDDAGSPHQSNFFSNGTVTFDAANPGRGTITFLDNSFPFTYAFYMSSASSGVVEDVTGNGVIADGSIAAQSAGPFTSSNITGTYAMNWSGLATNGSSGVMDEEDLVAQTTVTNLSLSGTADLYQFSASVPTPILNLGVGGSISINGDGTSGDGKRSGLAVNLTGSNAINFVIYIVNPQTAFFAVSSGTTHLDAGVLQAQQ